MDELWSWLGYPRLSAYRDLDLSALPLNSAYVVVNITLDYIVGVYSVKDDCIGCPYKLQQTLFKEHDKSWIVEADFPSTWKIMNSDNASSITRQYRRGLICQLRPTFEEYGVYSLDVSKCAVKPLVEPINIYLPLILCLLILLAGTLIKSCISFVLKRRQKQEDDSEQGEELEKVKNLAVIETKKMSTLYVFRGLVLSLLIFITTGGGGYAMLTRSWGGFTPADCLFFAYVWTIGVKIPRSLDRAVEKGHTKCKVFTDVLKRSLVLLFIGTLIDSTIKQQPKLFEVTLWCPLQRMAVAYFVTALAYVLTVQKFEMESKNIVSKVIANVVSLLWCWIITIFLFAVMIICIVTFISFNCQSNRGLEFPNSDPSNITEVSNSCTRHNDLTQLVNKIFMATPDKIMYINSYFGFTKGLFGMIAIIIQCMIGLKAGAVYWHHEGHGDRIKLWIIWAVVFAVGAVIFASLSIPLKLNLWPISTIIMLSTISMLIFTIVYVFVESTKIAEMAVLRSAGITSVAVFSGHLLFSKSLPFYFGLYLKTHFEILLQNIWILSLWLIIGYILMRERVRFSF